MAAAVGDGSLYGVAVKRVAGAEMDRHRFREADLACAPPGGSTAQSWCPKSAAGTRDVPLIDLVINTLQEHRPERCAKGREPPAYVFANSRGNIDFHSAIQDRGFRPIQLAAGIIGEGEQPKYRLHALRHFFASFIIGLRQYSPKEVQDMLGHASVVMTFDTYSGLFKKTAEEEQKDRERLEEGARFLTVAT
jgi:integrase